MKYKQYQLDPWCKKAKIAQIEQDLSTDDLCAGTGYSKGHLVSVMNGKIISYEARDRISDFLGISND